MSSGIAADDPDDAINKLRPMLISSAPGLGRSLLFDSLAR